MAMQLRSLDASFFDSDPELVARNLIGTILVRRLNGSILVRRIVETEAYLPIGEAAAHGTGGLRRGNRALFWGPGTIYVHSMHRQNCLDLVTQNSETPGSVLTRALEPIAGYDIMRMLRGSGAPVL